VRKQVEPCSRDSSDAPPKESLCCWKVSSFGKQTNVSIRGTIFSEDLESAIHNKVRIAINTSRNGYEIKYLREAYGFISQSNDANGTSYESKALTEQEILQRLRGCEQLD
jgi:hypothetical protein